MAVEDAAVLGALLSHVSSLAQVPALLQAYQDLRYVTHPLSSLTFLPHTHTQHPSPTHRNGPGYRARQQRKTPRGSTKRSSTCRTAPRSARGTKRCTPRWRPSSMATTREGVASRRFRQMGTRTSGQTEQRVGSSLVTMCTQRSSAGGLPADVSVLSHSLVMGILAPMEVVPGCWSRPDYK
jgi:hypothetical protein